MKTRNSDTSKSTAIPKKASPSTPAKKSAAKNKATPPSAELVPAESPSSATPKPSDTKCVSATTAKQAMSAETFNTPPNSVSQLEPSPVVEEKKTPDDAAVTTGAKPATGTKRIVKKIVKRVVRKTPIARAAASQTPKSEEPEKTKVEEPAMVDDAVETLELGSLAKDKETVKTDEVGAANVEEPEKTVDTAVENIEVSMKEELNAPAAEEEARAGEGDVVAEISSTGGEEKFPQEQELTLTEGEHLENLECNRGKDKEELKVLEKDQLETIENKVETKSNAGDTEEDSKEEMTDFDGLLEEADDEGLVDHESHDEFGQEDIADDIQQCREEAAALEEEHAELNAAAKERRLRKELEIFVGGLDRDVVEDDIKRVFCNAGEVVDVRLHKDLSTNKNKGYAFVRFATKEQASRALSEMRNPVIRGKRCGTAPSEDNDTIFLGNICNTWTKEAIKQKLKEYGVEGVEKITLVADPKHEGLSRGFAFVEFCSHAEAILAYKRLQKPDVVFGHSERTAKVAFAEPLREPDPDVMCQVKSVFVDGLPPHWDEDRVREKFKKFGEIARVMLARNMSTAKRKDFGFVDFASHEAAVACVDGLNSAELDDGNSKTKVKARLSNPLPKTQAVKGEMAGGFRIAGGTFPRFGRGLGRGGHAFNRVNFQHDRGFYPREPGQSRMGYGGGYEFDRQYRPFPERQNFGRGGRWGFRGAHQIPSGGPSPTRPYLDRARYSGHGVPEPVRRQPFPSEEAFNRPYFGQHYEDPYYYDETAHRMKRPHFMTNPDYVEPSTRRPRFDYAETSVSHRGTHYQDTFGADAGPYPPDYYGSDYRGGMRPPFDRGDRLYGRGYY